MRFYSEIIALAGRFFGLSTDATESEVHQALTEAKTYDELKADAIKEAGVTMEKMNEISSNLEAMSAQMFEIKTDNEAKTGQIEALDSRVSELNKALEEKDKTITAQKAEIDSLSSSLATYKVKAVPGDSPTASNPADQGIPLEAPKKGGSKQVVSNAQFQEMFN